MRNLYEVLEKLCLAPAPSGYEKNSASAFAGLIKPYANEVRVDKMGNVIARIDGTVEHARTVMAYAHMDQLGFIVRKIERNGFIQVDRLGGIPEKILPALRLVIRNKDGRFVPAVFGNKAHHSATAEEKYKVDVVTSLYIDVGASSAEEVYEMGIDIGCPAIYEPRLSRLGRDKVCGTALDDRGGLAALVCAAEILHGNRPDCTTYLVGTIWEEFNIRGAAFAARSIRPDIALGLDVALAGDTPDLEKNYPDMLGKGPTVNLYNFHGRGTLNGMIPNERLVTLAEKSAEEAGIPHQRFASLGIITESAYIQMECDGIACLDFGFPARYTHSPIETCALPDIENLGKLVAATISNIAADMDISRYRIE